MGIGLSNIAGITDLKYSYMRSALRDAGCECPREVPVVSELPFILWHGVTRKMSPQDICLVKCVCSRCQKRCERKFFTSDLKGYDGYLSVNAWIDIRDQGPKSNGCHHDEIYLSNKLNNRNEQLVYCIICRKRWTVEQV